MLMPNSNIVLPTQRGKMLQVNSPYGQRHLAEVDQYTVEDYDAIMSKALKGRALMQAMPRHRRYAILMQAAQSVMEKTDTLARTIASESAKPITQARGEVKRCATTLRLSAEATNQQNGEVLPFDSVASPKSRLGFYQREPLGLILAVTPFNDPLNLVAHKLGPAIAGGNAVILKPSNFTPLSALALTEILYACGLPKEALITTPCERELTQKLLQNRDIRMLSLTGGESAAHAMTASSGLKKLCMELGGNAPVIVCADTNIERAAAACCEGAMGANGQSCISVQRIIVEKSVEKIFTEKFLQKVASLKCGDPLDESTDIGPLIHQKAADHYLKMFAQASAEGAAVLLPLEAKENLVKPAVIASDKPTLFDDHESFAPFAQISSFANDDEALARANHPEALIAAAVFTDNINRAINFSQRLQAASVMINDHSDNRIDAMPFGGAKYGSLGREGVAFALREMTQEKTICINLSSAL